VSHISDGVRDVVIGQIMRRPAFESHEAIEMLKDDASAGAC